MPRTAATNRSAASNRVKVLDIKSSLSFNGTSSYMTSPVVPDPSGFCFGLWVKTEINVSGSTEHYVSINSAGFTDGFGLQRNTTGANVLKLRVYNGPTSLLDIPSAPLSRGQWSHIACSYLPSGVCNIYTNGVLTNSGTSTGTMGVAVGQNMTFFKRSYTGVYTKGSMSGFVFENTTTPWTQQQVTDLYRNGTVPSGATAVYPLQEGAGTTAYDSSGNGNNGTITNGTFTSDVPTKKRGVVGGNLVYNGDFEYAPRVNVPQTTGGNWVDGSATGSGSNTLFGYRAFNYLNSFSAQFDSTVKRSGSYSLKISTTGVNSTIGLGTSGSGTNPPYITCSPSTSYTVTFWMKTNVVSGDAASGAFMRLSGGTTADSTKIRTTTDWTQYTLSVTTSSTANKISIEVRIIGNDGAGTLIMDAWFDDIELRPTTPTTRTAV